MVEKALHFVQDNPGCHLRRIKRVLGISMGTVQYQLDKLEGLHQPDVVSINIIFLLDFSKKMRRKYLRF
jgi:predicted transcriptional regulator